LIDKDLYNHNLILWWYLWDCVWINGTYVWIWIPDIK